MREFGNLSIQEIVVVTSAYMFVCPYVRMSRLWGRGRDIDVPIKATGRGRRMSSFLGKRIVQCFYGQPAFFLVGNHMIIVSCEK